MAVQYATTGPVMGVPNLEAVQYATTGQVAPN